MRAFCGFLLFLLMLSGVVKGEEIRFLTHGVTDYSYIDVNGDLRGVEHKGFRAFLIEAIRGTMDNVGYPTTDIRVYPFPRALRMVQQQDNYALFNVGRSKKRENTVKWVGPLHQSEVYFYKRRGSNLEITTLEDAKKVSVIAVQNGAGDEAFLKDLGFSNLLSVPGQGNALKMLSMGRVDLTPVGMNMVKPLLLNFSIDSSEIERTSLKLSDTKGYIAFSKNVDDQYIDKWQSALDEFKNSAQYEQIVEKYLTIGP